MQLNQFRFLLVALISDELSLVCSKEVWKLESTEPRVNSLPRLILQMRIDRRLRVSVRGSPLTAELFFTLNGNPTMDFHS